MNHIIKTLVFKDIQLNRLPLFIYLLLGLSSLVMLSSETPILFYAGVTILLSAIIITGAQMVITTVTNERTDQVMPFIMSLPISFRQYTHAKVCANLGVFLVFWLLMLGGLMVVIFGQPQVPDGLAVYAVILLLEMLAVFCLVLAVGLISESHAWTIVVISLTNVALSIFMFWTASFEGIQQHMQTDAVVWNQTAVTFVITEVLMIVACLILTYVIQGRKKDFV
ncbi:ABC transporter permease [Marinicella sediminis]|uniref:ABC transporter permease n=1 Tax=Marinicella sediminis TaxID=1792834 RepID=A0ABV7J7M8_9GAMM|nr:ABC transporter permease [Marinicella sediminis]